ncbi:hypothetical protein OEA41_001333 [Lepraria neglecta]|uniref:Poly [ADP-ribose] polymerase n=1 Tax=Lepraria neglecta TaxID=209136 RepID=A0AAE0DLA5_9LECA|nr:hypothetical protein OEA41_001333 [Lepraria neglecta]
MPPKRKASGKQTAKAKAKQPKQDGQKAVSHDINVPLDEGFNEDAKVYIDDNGIIFDASLNQTNIGGNNNKFYRLQLLNNEKDDNYFVHTRWGRVGEFGQVKAMGPMDDLEDALKEYNKKFKDKSGNKWDDRSEPAKKGKYTFLERNYEDDEDEAEDQVKKEDADDDQADSKLPRQTQRLMELIFNQNHFNAVLESIGYNANKLPLGKLSKATLKQGFEHLHELASLIKHPSLAQNKYGSSQKEAIEDFSNKYYSTIPHEFGRNRPPPIDDNEILRKETSMLDTLTDMEVANTIMKTSVDKDKDAESINTLDKRFKELNMNEMTPLDHKSDEYKALADYLIKSSGTAHGMKYRLEDIFRIERAGEADRFAKSKYGKWKKKDKRLLWHGSRTTNYGGILSQGLRIAPPEAPVSGYAFGKGIYLADMSSKSAQYCRASMSGGTGLLLLCEAELGRPMYEIPTGDFDAEEQAKKHNCISTLGVGRTAPQGWMDGESVHESLKGVRVPDPSKGLGDNKDSTARGYLAHNEYICYDVAQLKLKYLFRVGI